MIMLMKMNKPASLLAIGVAWTQARLREAVLHSLKPFLEGRCRNSWVVPQWEHAREGGTIEGKGRVRVRQSWRWTAKRIRAFVLLRKQPGLFPCVH